MAEAAGALSSTDGSLEELTPEPWSPSCLGVEYGGLPSLTEDETSGQWSAVSPCDTVGGCTLGETEPAASPCDTVGGTPGETELAAGGDRPDEGTRVEFGGVSHVDDQSCLMTGGDDLGETETAAGGNHPGKGTRAGYGGEINLDAMVADDRSYCAPQLQLWIFRELSRYYASRRAGTTYDGLDIFPTNLRYSTNAARLLETSDSDELRRKAYIIRRDGSRAASDSSEPFRMDFTACSKVQLLNHGNEQARLGYLGGCLKEIGAKRKLDVNPQKIKVWAFFLLTGGVQEKVLQLQINDKRDDKQQEDKRVNKQQVDKRVNKQQVDKRVNKQQVDKRVNKQQVKLSLEELGDALCIVLPADYEPVTLKRALRLLLSQDLVEFLQQQLAVTNSNFSQPAQAGALDSARAPHRDVRNSGFSKLKIMLDNLYSNDWADWVQDPAFIRPPLAKIMQFALTHGHLPGVQSAEEIAQGDFNAPEHFKTSLMYQELYLQYLDEHANEIAKLKSQIEMLQTREAKFLEAPWASQRERALSEYQVSQ